MQITRDILIEQRKAEGEARDEAIAKVNAALGRIQLLTQLIDHLDQPEVSDDE